MKQGTRVIVVDVREHELSEKQRKGTIVSAYGKGFKVAVDGLDGGVLYFRRTQLKEERR